MGQNNITPACPIPCKKFMGESLFEMLWDIREELEEVRDAAVEYKRIDEYMPLTGEEIEAAEALTETREHLAEELTDVITACTTMLARIGYNRRKRRLMQRYVNDKNRKRGYHDAPTGR